MTREEAKNLLPLIQAFADGKKIEFEKHGDGARWTLAPNPEFENASCQYRVKPEPKYRPFRNTEECWQEMQKHQPFGWIMRKGHRYQITGMTDNAGVFCEDGCDNLTLVGYLNDGWTFADGTPFGVKEDGTA